MYRIDVDDMNKIINVELSGSMTLQEINNLIVELSKLAGKLQQKQYAMLVMAQRLDPFSQENLSAVQKIIEITLGFVQKVAILNGNRTITEMQLKRIESAAMKSTASNTPIVRFRVIKEAIKYVK